MSMHVLRCGHQVEHGILNTKQSEFTENHQVDRRRFVQLEDSVFLSVLPLPEMSIGSLSGNFVLCSNRWALANPSRDKIKVIITGVSFALALLPQLESSLSLVGCNPGCYPLADLIVPQN